MNLSSRRYVPTPKGLKLDENYRLCRQGNLSGFFAVQEKFQLSKDDLFFILRRDAKTADLLKGGLRTNHYMKAAEKDVLSMIESAKGNENYLKIMLGEVYLACEYKIPLETLLSFQYNFGECDLAALHAEVYKSPRY